MLISGQHKCKCCNSIIEWEYIVPQRLGSQLQVERLDNKKAHPIKIDRLSDNEYVFQTRCKLCDNLNEFTYYSERYL